MSSTSTLTSWLELLNLYPSPHNGQPIQLKQLDDTHFEVYFQRERGLQAADISYIFSFVTMGVFMEYAQSVSEALGHDMSYELQLPTEDQLHGTGVVKFGELKLHWDAQAPQTELTNALLFRQTSRKKYHEGLTEEAAAAVINLAADRHMNLTQLTEQQASQAIWLNQRAVFDDMFDPAVSQELDHWLRYSKQEKETKRDGLAYDCMELNGRTMKYIVHHPAILRAPIISRFIQQYYLRTMSDKSDVFYMRAPFVSGLQAFDTGVVISRIWIALSARGFYLHPFGTIMSNHAAHQDFLKMAGVSDESREQSYLVFIFRAGKSATPTKSLRLPYQQHLLLGADHV